MVHQEADGVATTSTPETFVDLFGRGYGKRGRFLVMKWAKAQVVHASFFQLHESTYDFDNIDSTEYLLDGLLRNHLRELTLIFWTQTDAREITGMEANCAKNSSAIR